MLSLHMAVFAPAAGPDETMGIVPRALQLTMPRQLKQLAIPNLPFIV